MTDHYTGQLPYENGSLSEAGLRVLASYYGAFYLDYNPSLGDCPWTLVLIETHDVDGNELMFTGPTAKDAIDAAFDLMKETKYGVKLTDIPTFDPADLGHTEEN